MAELNQKEKIDLSKMNVEQLKALAYDFHIQARLANNNLSVVEQEIVKRQSVQDKKEGDEK